MKPKSVKQCLRLGTVSAALLAMAAGLGPATARGANYMTYGQMTARADLIVIARPKSNKDTAERISLLGTPVVGVDTEFSTVAVLKAKDPSQTDVQRAGQTFVLHHYRVADPAQPISDGPDLVQFDPKTTTQYLMFLTRRDENRFEPLTGQSDARFSLEQLLLPADPEPQADQTTGDAASAARGAIGMDKNGRNVYNVKRIR